MKPVLVAIVGGSASGKSTLARDLVRSLRPGSALISQDSFYRDASRVPASRRRRLNFDHPRRIDWPLLLDVLTRALDGRAVDVPRYSFEDHARESRTDRLKPSRFLVAEGLWLLRQREIRALCDLGIFVACPAPVRLARRIQRDTTERGRTRTEVLHQWSTQTQPGFRDWVAPQLRLADEIVRSPVPDDRVADLTRRIRSLRTPRTSP
ncbi:MAG: uridine kinase [Limisphaerales bacterium]